MIRRRSRRNALTWEEDRGQAEGESPPTSSLAREPHRSHPGPAGRREGPRAERSPRSRNRPEDEGGSGLGGSRSAEPRAGQGCAGWAGRGGSPPRCRQLRGSADARRQWLEPCPFLPRSLPAPVPPSSSTQRSGEGPTPGAPAAQLLGCAGSRPRRAHSLPLGANSQASMARALRGWWVRAPQRWAARGARGPGGRRPAARAARAGDSARGQAAGAPATPPPLSRAGDPQRGGAARTPNAAARLLPSVSHSGPGLRARPVMSGGGEG